MSVSAGAVAGAASNYNSHVDAALAKLTSIYRKSIQPLEDRCEYSVFKGNGWFADGIKQKQAFALFIGPYSSGKSTFINYLLQSNHLATGPQPVTDKFGVIFHGDEHQTIPGRVLVANSELPFRALEEHGTVFVDALEGVQVPHDLLRSVTLIDTPGVLESASAFHHRRYDYTRAVRWFVERSDVIYFVFDPTKLDAGPELRMLFKHGIKGYEGRVRIILNKADMLRPQELLRVYGSLFWNLSTLLDTTEPPRVFVSSFWHRPYRPGTDHALFADEKADLICELVDTLPRMGLDNRVATVIRHANAVLSHALVCGTVRGRLPSCCGQSAALRSSIDQLPPLLAQVAAKWRLPAADLAEQRDAYKKFFEHPGIDVEDFPDVDGLQRRGAIEACRRAIDTDLPALLRPIRSGPVPDPHERRRTLMAQRGELEGGAVAPPAAAGKLLAPASFAASAGATFPSSIGFDATQLLLVPSASQRAVDGVPVATPPHPLLADVATLRSLQPVFAQDQKRSGYSPSATVDHSFYR